MRYKVEGTVELEEFFDVIIEADDQEEAEVLAREEIKELYEDQFLRMNIDNLEEIKVIT